MNNNRNTIEPRQFKQQFRPNLNQKKTEKIFLHT